MLFFSVAAAVTARAAARAFSSNDATRGWILLSFAGGPQFMSASAAQPTVPFQIVVPKWGQPDVVETLPDVANVPAPAFVLAMVFHLPKEGTVLLREQLQNMDSLEHLKELADTNFGSLSREPSPSPGCRTPSN